MSYQQHLTESSRLTGTKRKRSSQDSFEEEIAWTATRCQRLLRSLTSRINTLRKLLNTDASVEKNSSASYRGQPKKQQPKQSEHWSVQDPVWLPNGTSKPQTRTYTGRPKTSKRSEAQSRKSLAFPSPFVKRLKGDANADCEDSSAPSAVPQVKTRKSRKLPVKPESVVQANEKGLLSALTSVLSTTKAAPKSTSTGPRSLLSTCLRQISAYIELEDGESDSGSVDYDVTSEVFSYLEGFGTQEGGGWSRLREVVRSQSVHLIASAIEESLLSEGTISDLIASCSSQSAIPEGQILLGAWLKATQAPTTNSVEALDTFINCHDCHGFKFRTLRAIGIDDDSVLIRLSSSPTIWKDLLSSLAGAACPDALQYLTTAACTLGRLERAGQPKPRVASQVRDTVLKLTVMAAAGVMVGEPLSSGRNLCDTMHIVAAQVALKHIRGSRGRRKPPGLSDTETLIMLGSQFLHGLQGKSQLSFSAFDSTVVADMFNITTRAVGFRQSEMRIRQENFATESTKGLMTLEKHMGIAVTKRLLDRSLEAIEFGSSAAALLKQVAVEVATVLRQSDDLEDDAEFEQYLKRLNTPVQASSSTETPYRAKKPGQFRWEDGLCEWVAKTPFTSGWTASQVEAVSEDDEEEHVDTSFGTSEGEISNPAIECSPDILALSPPAKRVKREVRSPTCKGNKKVRKGIVVIPVYKPEKQTSSKVSNDAGDESCDELCF